MLLQVQLKGPGTAPTVLSRGNDIHRNTAEQQAARATMRCRNSAQPGCVLVQVQVKGPGAAPAVLSRAYDIHKNTAEQQAARAALQSMGLQVPSLPLSLSILVALICIRPGRLPQ